MEQKQPLQQMVLRDLDTYFQKNETRSATYAIHKNKFKVDKRLKYQWQNHISPTGKHWQENLTHSMQQQTHRHISRARDIKERINKWDLIKIKSFCMAKENSIKMKGQPTVWESIFPNDTSDKGLISKIYKELTRLHSRKTNNPIKKWAKDLNRHFSKEDIQRTQRHMKRCSASLAIREMQIKTTMRYHFTLVRMVIKTKSPNNKC